LCSNAGAPVAPHFEHISELSQLASIQSWSHGASVGVEVGVGLGVDVAGAGSGDTAGGADLHADTSPAKSVNAIRITIKDFFIKLFLSIYLNYVQRISIYIVVI